MIGISLYLIPVIFFNYSLNLSTSFFKLLYWCNQDFASDQDEILRAIWITIFGAGFVLILFADICSNYIDKKILLLGKHFRSIEKNIIDIKQLLKIMLLVFILVFAFLQLINHSLFSSLPKIAQRR